MLLSGGERNSGDGMSNSFASWIEQKGLIDLGFSGQKFTWNSGTIVETRCSVRLDRGICDDS